LIWRAVFQDGLGRAAMLGLLRRRAGGLLAPFLAHAVADATIAWVIFARYGR
jgi:hypothetical protein